MKKTSLSAALKHASRQPEPALAPVNKGAPAARSNGTVPPPSRAGKKAITGFFDPAVSKQLRQLGLEREASVQELMREALNDLFRKHGRPPIA